MISSFIQFVRRRVLIEIRRWSEWYARFYLKHRPDLWRQFTQYTEQTGSTGCNMTDYYVLYKQIRNIKPVEILECGTGVSTLVIAHTLTENEKETGKYGRVALYGRSDQMGRYGGRLASRYISQPSRDRGKPDGRRLFFHVQRYAVP